MRTLLLILTMCLFVLPAHAKYSGGSGTAQDPYGIATAADLILLGDSPADYDKHFLLTADIDLDPKLPGRKVFDKAVIGSFTGIFDGNGRTISHLTIKEVKGWGYLGLFSSLGSGAEVRDLGVVDVSITGWGDCVGGLVGVNQGDVTQCYSTGAVNGTGEDVGGLVGYNDGGTVTQCYSTVGVSGDKSVGGLVGSNRGAVSDCYSTGAVNGKGDVGGLVGNNYEGSAIRCYSTGAVSGNGDIGGLVGSDSINFLGYEEGEIVSQCFWDIQTSGQAWSDGGTGKTTAQMHDPNTFRAAGWGFPPHDIWFEPEGAGCPILWWQLSPWPSLPTFSGGTGKSDDPYRISTAKDLNNIGHNPRLMKCRFKMVNDLDLTGLLFYPIGDGDYRYGGVFDGNGHTISHLTIKGENPVGLFGALGSGAEARNLGVVDVNITGSGPVGGLVGDNNGSVTQCFSTGSVRASAVNDPYGNIFATAGGLVGENRGTVTNCYSTGAVSGTGAYAGGLVGWNQSGTVTQCYSTGTVKGTGQGVGGLVGGWGLGVVFQCVWDIDKSGLLSSAGGVGLTTTKMMDPRELGLNGFGNDPNWVLDAGRDYPRLVWQGTPGHMIPEPNIGWLEGHGTVEDPYRVSTAEQLIGLGRVSLLWDRHVVLGADINLDPKLPGGEAFAQAVIPLFAGVFDGHGHAISHLTINGGSYVGLFGRLASGAEVRDLAVGAVSVTASGSLVGALVGFNIGGIVTDCYSAGRVSGDESVGGLVGGNRGDLKNCYSAVAVSGKDSVGGLVGSNSYYGTVTQCYSTGAVPGLGWAVGGLVGSNWGSVTQCYSTGAVSGTSSVGGLVGWNCRSVTHCYATGAVHGYKYVGGLVGDNQGPVIQCYSTGTVSDADYVGGLVGHYSGGSVAACFWDKQTSGRTGSYGGIGKTTAEMQTAKTFLGAGWDFIGETKNGTEDLWWILEGKDYPRLWWEAAKK